MRTFVIVPVLAVLALAGCGRGRFGGRPAQADAGPVQIDNVRG